MITLAFAQMIYYFAISWPGLWRRGRAVDLRAQPLSRAEHAGSLIQFFAIVATLLALALGLSALIVRSRFGLALGRCAATPMRLTAVGIRPFHVRLIAFVLSAMITGLAGALYADLNRFVSPSMLSLAPVGRDHDLRHPRRRRAAVPARWPGRRSIVLLEHLLGRVTDYWQFASRPDPARPSCSSPAAGSIGLVAREAARMR